MTRALIERSKPIVHGTPNAYVNYGCGCALCLTAWRVSQQGKRARLRAGAVPKHVHGSENGYGNYACRCDKCTEAHRVFRATHRTQQRMRDDPK